MTRVLVDTGFLYAAADGTDVWHERARTWMADNRAQLLVPITVIPEVSHMFLERLGRHAERDILEAIRLRQFLVEGIDQSDMERIVEVLDKYADGNIGFVDASIVALAERLGIKKLLTTDRRHFAAIRPKHCKSLELLP